MKNYAAIAMLLALTLGCGGGSASRAEPKPESKAEPKVELKPEAPGEARPALMPAKLADPEPQRILIAHVLISFAGTETKATRTQAAAEKLAYEVLARARKGEDFNKLIRDVSDDVGEGVYGLANHRVSPVDPEFERRRMVPGFGDVGFKLEVGSVGMAPYDPQKSKYGWHIIKRLR